jgi:hypothetical protein
MKPSCITVQPNNVPIGDGLPDRILYGVARGFESKDVEFQQSEAERAKEVRPALTAEQREAQASRRTIELALTCAKGDLASARTPAHREMLEQAIAALEEQLNGSPPQR